jgi:hypothetical protein
MTQSQNKRLRNRRLLSWNNTNTAQMGHQTSDLGTSVGVLLKSPARDAAKSPNVIKRSPQLVLFVALAALASVPVCSAAPGTVSGVVRDSAGAPQVGAEVELLRPDLSVLATVYTNSIGRYTIPSVVPGRYAVKALGASFLPSLREGVRVHSSAVVDLTLNTLYEVVQWLPSEPRGPNTDKDDWKWTLRSAANRPLLRWLEDGPLVVVSDGSAGSHKLKARLVATGRQGAFGESGERVATTVEETPSNSRELLAQVDFAPGSDAGMESMLGFRQDLGFAGSVESVAAVSIHPEIESGSSDGLDEAAVRSWQTIHLGDELTGEVGSTQVLARFAQNSPNTIAAALPFANVAWHDGASTVHYRLATAMPAPPDVDDTEAQAWLPAVGMRNGQLALEHGLHQEIGWERETDNAGVSILVYADRTDNAIMEAALRPSDGDTNFASAQLLVDPVSGLVRAAGPGYSSAGIMATVERRLPARSTVRLTYANGDALVLGPPAQSAGLAQVLSSAHPRHAQTYSISLSGTIDGSGTRWRATYRWQPESTLTPVAPFAEQAADPYLNVHFRQPIHIRRDGSSGLEAVINLRNLLAQGYRPYVLSDGSLLMFAQDQRGFSGGLAFNF